MDNPLIVSDIDSKNLAEALSMYGGHTRGFGSMIRSGKFAYLRTWLDSKTPLLQNGDYNYVTKLYWVANGLTDFPACGFCGKTKLERNVDDFRRGYFRACSKDCAGMKAERVRKIGDACFRKFGSRNFFGSDTGKKARKDWCDAHWVENPFQLEVVKQKSKQTRFENFGSEFTMQSVEKRELASRRYHEKTGYDQPFKNPAVIRKALQTKNGNSEHVASRPAASNANRHARYVWFSSNPEIRPLFSEETFMSLDRTTQYTEVLRWKCLKCGNEFDACLDQNMISRFGLPVRCPICRPVNQGVSTAEIEFGTFLKNLGFSVVEHDRSVISPYELDFIFPDKNLAFEFDGLFWHSEGAGKDWDYHLRKTRLCGENGVTLVHVFEDEWRDRRPIVESRVKDMLGIYGNTVYARKCEIREVSSGESRTFLDENHLQGHVNGSVRFGLYSGGVLVSLMIFGKSRFSGKYQWEMLRFCSRLGYHVPGAAGKLLKHFERNIGPDSLVSYADLRWSTGNLYKALGFNFVGNSPPGYFYVKGDRRYSRVMFQKHRLKDRLKKFDPEKTEVQNMTDNGYFRIFDCGNAVFEKRYLKG